MIVPPDDDAAARHDDAAGLKTFVPLVPLCSGQTEQSKSLICKRFLFFFFVCSVVPYIYIPIRRAKIG